MKELNRIFMAEDDGGNGAGTFAFTDPERGTVVNLPEKVGDVNLKELVGHIISKTRKEVQGKVESKYQPLLNELSQHKEKSETLEQELEKLQAASMSAEDLIKRSQSKWESQIQAEKKNAEANWHLFESTKVENDLYAAMSGIDLCNPNQTMLLIKSIGQPTVIKDENGRYKTVVKMALPNEQGEVIEAELSPNDAFKKWISLDENKHHLRNNLRPGAGTSSNGRVAGSGSTNFKAEDLLNSPEARKDALQKMKSGETVNIQR